MKYNYYEDWKNLSINDFMRKYELNFDELFNLSIKENLADHKPHIDKLPRIWTKEEEELLIKYSNTLTLTECSNILHRPRYGTYQRVKKLGLNNMIKNKGELK